ncbi:undecaprenyl/decaprenyl-phosphate alpha-N-acetylglucosaminyl 1-phosphate transferase [Streptomyces adelaidensis]|uniref:undecaprenyl/decaprenyl-phosphate alpha-N-acetylglucosaminyl 1-phosphate transferase n=1 Tax=Streptomyces adelaidensis TaxID=2796465 RepID=UPI001906DD2C|nr:undecaprenyl/decaprenyl-phosphate alpha-N-acetylglucosaminyl 1-phosphate transferase [Streptomyces adelaidensis]
MLYGILASASALLITALLAAVIRVPALRFGIVERRRMRPVPLLGGVALVGGVGGVAWVGEWSGFAPLGVEGARLLVAGAAVAGLGLVRDLWGLSFVPRAVGVTCAAVFVVPYEEVGVVGGMVAVPWMVLVVHGFKGLGRPDGVLGVVGVVTAFALSACAAAEVVDGLAALLSVLAAGLTGFLMQNWPPARVALGECGALFVGFLLAGGVVQVYAYAAGHGVGVGMPFALTALVTADAVLVLVSRKLARRELWRSGPDHLAHRMRRLGLTPVGVVVVLGLCALASVLVGVAVHMLWMEAGGVWWVVGGAVVVVAGVLRVPVYGAASRPGRLGGPARPARPGRPRQPGRPCPVPAPGGSRQLPGGTHLNVFK